MFGGAIRTYFTPFDPAGERYPRRHLPMGDAKIRSWGAAALDRIVDGAIGETAHRELPEDVRRTLSAVYRVLAGRAELGEIAAAASRPSKTDAAREDLLRRMMAKTRPTASPVAKPSEDTGETEGNAEVAEVAAGKDTETGETVAVEAGPTSGVAEIAQSVADLVVKELRGELETALGLATSSQASGDSGRVLREVRTLGPHLSGLRDIVFELRDAVAERHDAVLPTGLPAEPHSEPPPRPHAKPPARTEDASDRLAAEIRKLRDEHLLLSGEYAEAVTNARKLAERVRWLERRLAEAGQPVYGVTGDEPVFEPGGLIEVLAEARESLRHIGVGDIDDAAARLDLEHHVQCRTWAAKAWDALRALDDFAGARSRREFAGGFYDWCTNGSPTRLTIPTGMLSMRESKSVVSRAKFSAPASSPYHPRCIRAGRC